MVIIPFPYARETKHLTLKDLKTYLISDGWCRFRLSFSNPTCVMNFLSQQSANKTSMLYNYVRPTLVVYSLLTRRHGILNHDTKIHITSNADCSANDRGGSRPLMAAKTHNVTKRRKKTPWTKWKGVGLQCFKSTNIWKRPCPCALPKISTSVDWFLMSALHIWFFKLILANNL